MRKYQISNELYVWQSGEKIKREIRNCLKEVGMNFKTSQLNFSSSSDWKRKEEIRQISPPIEKRARNVVESIEITRQTARQLSFHSWSLMKKMFFIFFEKKKSERNSIFQAAILLDKLVILIELREQQIESFHFSAIVYRCEWKQEERRHMMIDMTASDTCWEIWEICLRDIQRIQLFLSWIADTQTCRASAKELQKSHIMPRSENFSSTEILSAISRNLHICGRKFRLNNRSNLDDSMMKMTTTAGGVVGEMRKLFSLDNYPAVK